MPKQKSLQPPLATSSERKPNERSYAAFIEGLSLVGLGLKGCSAKLNRGAFFESTKRGKKTSRVIAQKYNLVDVSNGAFDVEGTYTLTISGPDSTPALMVDCTFEAHVHVKLPFERSHAERFAKSEMRLLLVPYARQFISNITSQMAIPPIVVPLITRAED
jgi:hypothetical protein